MPGILHEKGFAKEQVQRRLMQHAAELWNIPDGEVEAFDPLVGLLFGAFAKEMEKIGQEVASSQTRVLHRLAQLLVPNVQTGPLPAHAVMQAFPVEATYTTRLTDQFCLRAHEKAGGKDVFFTPALPQPLHRGDIRRVAFGDKLYAVNGAARELVGTARPGHRADGYWIGLDLKGSPLPAPLCLYLDCEPAPGGETPDGVFQFAQWSLDDAPLRSTPGLPLPGGMSLLEEYGRQVSSQYGHHFVTLHTGGKVARRQRLPAALASVFPAADPAGRDEELYWLRVAFSRPLPDPVLETVRYRFNCFPVINRRRHGFSYRLQPMFNIVPLETEDIFYCVESVTDTAGAAYSSLATPDYRKQPEKTYFLRQEGVGRFDQRDATEMLAYLTDLLRDESAAFSALGRDYLSGEVRELNQIVNRFAQYLGQFSGEGRRGKPFLFVKSPADGNAVFVNFWSTLGVQANRIPAGTAVEAFASADYARGTPVLVTPTGGGRDLLGDQDRLKTFRSALLSRGRLVTAEDIRAFCHAELGDLLEHVEVRRGVAVGEEPGSGLVRTLDVLLRPSESGKARDWYAITADLKTKMEAIASVCLPFRLVVVE